MLEISLVKAEREDRSWRLSRIWVPLSLKGLSEWGWNKDWSALFRPPIRVKVLIRQLLGILAESLTGNCLSHRVLYQPRWCSLIGSSLCPMTADVRIQWLASLIPFGIIWGAFLAAELPIGWLRLELEPPWRSAFPSAPSYLPHFLTRACPNKPSPCNFPSHPVSIELDLGLETSF